MAVQIKVRLQSVCQSESVYCNVNRTMRGCVHLLFPGAGGAVCLWHLWSTGSVRAPPRCRCSAHLRLESNCTPATPPLVGWSAFRNAGTVVNTKATCLQADTLNSFHHAGVTVMKLQRWTAMYSHSYPCGLSLPLPQSHQHKTIPLSCQNTLLLLEDYTIFLAIEFPIKQETVFSLVSSHKASTEHPAGRCR